VITLGHIKSDNNNRMIIVIFEFSLVDIAVNLIITDC